MMGDSTGKTGGGGAQLMGAGTTSFEKWANAIDMAPEVRGVAKDGFSQLSDREKRFVSGRISSVREIPSSIANDTLGAANTKGRIYLNSQSLGRRSNETKAVVLFHEAVHTGRTLPRGYGARESGGFKGATRLHEITATGASMQMAGRRYQSATKRGDKDSAKRWLEAARNEAIYRSQSLFRDGVTGKVWIKRPPRMIVKRGGPPLGAINIARAKEAGDPMVKRLRTKGFGGSRSAGKYLADTIVEW